MVRLILAAIVAAAVIALTPIRSEAASPANGTVIFDQKARFMPVYYVRHGYYHGYRGYGGYHGYHGYYGNRYGNYHRPYYGYGYNGPCYQGYAPYYHNAYYGSYGCYWSSHRVWTAYGWHWRRVRVCH